MSSIGIPVTPHVERFSPPPPQAGPLTSIVIKDFGRSHQVSGPGLASTSKLANFPGQSTCSHPQPPDSPQTPPANGEAGCNDPTVQQFSMLQVVSVQTGVEQGCSDRREKVRMNGMANGHVGPPPPSPPASVERDFTLDTNAAENLDGTPHDDPGFTQPSLRLVAPPPRMDAEDGNKPLPTLPPQQLDSALTPQRPATISSTQPSSILQSSAMTAIATTTVPATTPSSQPPALSNVGRSSTHTGPPPSSYLHPPCTTSKGSRARPIRRNTTGSNPAGAAHIHAVQFGSAPAQSRDIMPSGDGREYGAAFDDGIVMGINLGTSPDEQELASEIQQAAEQIRRERQSKRAKQQALQAQHDAVEAALYRSDTRRSVASGKEDVVLVGNLIGEGHVNYVLMYNMLTGIRVGVSRCQAKLKRALTSDDFRAAHKMSFDIMGNELTPSAKYDFKFKDYAPWVFRSLREDVFHLDPADYLLSLTAKYILSELGSPGKSGSFFYFSRDYRFIIKTIHHAEHKFLLSILEKYYNHVQSNPHTLLSRFYGLHRVKLPRGRKIHFVIMNNLFPLHRDIHETYDLKGSTVGREYPEDKARQNPRAVMKDLNWINKRKMLEFGPEKRTLLAEQLRRDAEFLKTINVMDYSLLVGIHNMRRGNRDNVRKNTLKVFSPDIPRAHRKSGSTADAALVRRAMRNSQTKNLGEGKNSIKLPDVDIGGTERSHFLFYQDEGGLQATDESNLPKDTIYYLGIIDILTPWTVLKRFENCWKGISADRHKISPVPPAEYSQRFFNFMKAIMPGGEGSEKVKPE